MRESSSFGKRGPAFGDKKKKKKAILCFILKLLVQFQVHLASNDQRLSKRKAWREAFAEAKKGKREPTASLLRIHPHVGNHQRLFKCQYSPDAGSAWPGLKYAARRRGSGDPPSPSTHRITGQIPPRLCTSQTKAPRFFWPKWRPVIRVEKCSPGRSDN